MSAETLPFGRAALGLVPGAATATPGVEVVDTEAGFDGLREEWAELLGASSSDGVFLTWEWLHTWWTHLSGERRLAILVVRRGGQLLALAPFASRGSSLLGGPRLEFLGSGQVGSDYLDVIVRSGAEREAVASLASHLAQGRSGLDLRQVRLTASTASELVRELRRSGCPVRATRTHRCPFIDLRGTTWEAYLGSLGPEHRYNFRRRLRKLEAEHTLKFEAVTCEARLRQLLPVLFELHRLRWSEAGGSDGLEGPGIRPFHEELSRLALEQGRLRLHVLWLGGSPAAALYGFRYRGVFSFYQSGVDPRYRKLSVGLVALGLAIKGAIEEGAAEFDLLHGEEAYKFHWANGTRRLARLRVFPRGALGHLWWAAAAASERLRRLLPAGLRAALSAARQGGRRAAPAG